MDVGKIIQLTTNGLGSLHGNKIEFPIYDTDLKSEFVKWYPCIYMGAILCDDCPRKNCDDGDTCDMYNGRTDNMRAFEAGWFAHSRKIQP